MKIAEVDSWVAGATHVVRIRTTRQIGAICRRFDAPGRIRTSDPRIRSPPLCPLSYGRLHLG